MLLDNFSCTIPNTFELEFLGKPVVNMHTVPFKQGSNLEKILVAFVLTSTVVTLFENANNKLLQSALVVSSNFV